MKRFAYIFCIIITLITSLFAQPPDTLWTKTFGLETRDHGKCAIQTRDGGFILTGGTESYGIGDSDLWLIKTDSDGEDSGCR